MKNGALDHAELVAWICFGIGVLVLAVGVILGVLVAPKKAAKDQEKVKEAKQKLEEAGSNLEAAAAGNLEGDVAATASSTADQVKSAVEQVGGIVGSLPEYQRFPGLLVLIGVVLIGVGTVQFGGTQLF